jgi:hypothetical protein
MFAPYGIGKALQRPQIPPPGAGQAELNSLVEVNLGMTCEFYFQHRYNWHTYEGFVRFAQKACSKGECWLSEACTLLTFFEKLKKQTLDLGKGPQKILQIHQPGHEKVCAVCLHGAIPKEQFAEVKLVAKNAIAHGGLWVHFYPHSPPIRNRYGARSQSTCSYCAETCRREAETEEQGLRRDGLRQRSCLGG